jgi:hypothetical protein
MSQFLSLVVVVVVACGGQLYSTAWQGDRGYHKHGSINECSRFSFGCVNSYDFHRTNCWN